MASPEPDAIPGPSFPKPSQGVGFSMGVHCVCAESRGSNSSLAVCKAFLRPHWGHPHPTPSFSPGAGTVPKPGLSLPSPQAAQKVIT